MNARDLVGEAARSIAADRRQAALAIAGISCGVAAIMAALAIGDGARREALAEVESMGIDNVIVRSVASAPVGPARVAGPRLTLADADAIRSAVRDASAVAPLRSTIATVAAGSRSLQITVVGAPPEWNTVIAADVARGRWLRRRDMTDSRRVVVLGSDVAGDLFAAGDPVGRLVKVGADWHRVIGVLAARTDPHARRSTLSPFDLQRSAVVPLPDLDIRLGIADGADRVEDIAVRAKTADRVGAVAAAIGEVLRTRGASDVAQVIVPRELVAARLRARRAFDAVLLAVGGVALFISGIGIMNVMLSGVVRRTVEIGVRRAVGARRADIVLQFVAESTLLSVLGGGAGVGVGCVAMPLVSALAGWATVVASGAIAIALSLAIAVGVVFGAYPAYVAAQWTPCEALRHE